MLSEFIIIIGRIWSLEEAEKHVFELPSSPAARKNPKKDAPSRQPTDAPRHNFLVSHPPRAAFNEFFSFRNLSLIGI